ncbi:hypothetical protein KQX54_018088 [Cotesia glomerata]|uniref:Uncharacterized protein n=1 Tax=Cotesia glomerata TaxID=32391 RepID=A0AAV7I1B6_COTGL|nr:hypothetical protein KQX54_018088 [Cotesia glomerata]
MTNLGRLTEQRIQTKIAAEAELRGIGQENDGERWMKVACSTVTVTKCQAALKTLQAFSFFRPTCLCKEPHVDPECNSFQNFLFDHPCIYVLKKVEKSYTISKFKPLELLIFFIEDPS